MAQLVPAPVRIEAAGHPPKIIEEYVGRVATGTSQVSIAHMRSPQGWVEPAQVPEFDEYTVVLGGMLRVETDTGVYEVAAGQAIILKAGEKVRYSSPAPEGAQYVAVCLPAFSPQTVHREGD